MYQNNLKCSTLNRIKKYKSRDLFKSHAKRVNKSKNEVIKTKCLHYQPRNCPGTPYKIANKNKISIINLNNNDDIKSDLNWLQNKKQERYYTLNITKQDKTTKNIVKSIPDSVFVTSLTPSSRNTIYKYRPKSANNSRFANKYRKNNINNIDNNEYIKPKEINYLRPKSAMISHNKLKENKPITAWSINTNNNIIKNDNNASIFNYENKKFSKKDLNIDLTKINYNDSNNIKKWKIPSSINNINNENNFEYSDLSLSMSKREIDSVRNYLTNNEKNNDINFDDNNLLKRQQSNIDIISSKKLPKQVPLNNMKYSDFQKIKIMCAKNGVKINMKSIQKALTILKPNLDEIININKYPFTNPGDFLVEMKEHGLKPEHELNISGKDSKKSSKKKKGKKKKKK